LNSGDGVLIPDPGYPAYEAVAKLCNARSVFYDLSDSNGWFPDLERIESNGLEGIKMMWVNYPHMPSGVVAKKEQLDSLVEFGIRNSILIVNDNPYSLVLNPKPISIFSANSAMEIALELNSLSKSHNMAGWRVGVVSGAEEYIESVLKIVSNINSGMFLPVQQAAIEALKIDKVWYDELNNHYNRRRKLVYSMARALGCSFSKNQSGLFVWARIPEKEENSFEYSDSILEKYGVFITPGSVFGSNGHRYLRFSLCVPEERLEESRGRIDNSNRF
jgi:aspartate/methionine/tyrosine aminotransferase